MKKGYIFQIPNLDYIHYFMEKKNLWNLLNFALRRKLIAFESLWNILNLALRRKLIAFESLTNPFTL